MYNGIVDVKWSEKALESLREIGDQKKQDKIKKKVDHDLSKDPYKGEVLSDSFKGLRSFYDRLLRLVNVKNYRVSKMKVSKTKWLTMGVTVWVIILFGTLWSIGWSGTNPNKKEKMSTLGKKGIKKHKKDFFYADFINWFNSQPEPSYTEVRSVINSTTIKYQIKKPDGNLLTFAEFLGLLSNKNENFIKAFRMLGLGGESVSVNATIRNWNSAYFWECIPVSKTTINKPFEFVKTKSEALNRVTQNWTRFQEHIDRSDNPEVTSFFNLNKDSTLVIPMPKRGHQWSCTHYDNEIRDYKNLRMFLAEADLEQWYSFWQEIGKKMSESLEESDAPKWLSTHGLGVPYLHVRIDSVPKHYSFGEYRYYLSKSSPSF